jgi:hypothetical protein
MNMNTDLDPAFGNVADYLANEIKLADKTVLDAIPRRQDALAALRAKESPRLYLKGRANACDWRHARRVVDKAHDLLTNMHPDDKEAITRMIVRQIAKGRTRGARDALLALGHSVAHLYEPARESDE